MRKDAFNDSAVFDTSTSAVPYFGSELDQNISNEEYIANLYSSNIVSNMRNRSIRDSEINYGIRKCYLPNSMDRSNYDVKYMESLYKYYDIPIPESGVTNIRDIYKAYKSNGMTTGWWIRNYELYQTTHGGHSYVNYYYSIDGIKTMVQSYMQSSYAIRPIINLSNYTKVRSENDNYYID